MSLKLIPESVVLEQHLGGGIDRTTLFRWRRAKRFPEPVKFNGGRSLYVEAEVISAIERMVAERDRQVAAVAKVRGAQPATAGR